VDKNKNALFSKSALHRNIKGLGYFSNRIISNNETRFFKQHLK